MENNDQGSNINWSDVIKKEARGYNDIDLGEIQHVDNKALPHKREL